MRQVVDLVDYRPPFAGARRLTISPLSPHVPSSLHDQHPKDFNVLCGQPHTRFFDERDNKPAHDAFSWLLVFRPLSHRRSPFFPFVASRPPR
jgi:hypothetical protein